MTYGFLGAGNMGRAMIEGMICSGIHPSDIVVRDKLSQQAVTDMYKVCGADSYEELFSLSDMVFVVVKPKDCADAYAELLPFIKTYKRILVSVAAGVALSQIYGMIGETIPLVRIMPNLAARYCLSPTAMCPGHTAGAEDISAVTAALDTFGESFIIEEDHFNIFTSVASCSPAFTFMYIDALARAALSYGMDKKTAEKIAALSVAGAAELLKNSGQHPYELIDRVCSPGGMTLEGVQNLFESGFTASVMRAVSACCEKDKLLAAQR